MEYRQLGGSGFKVPVLSLGTGTFGGGGPLFKAWGATDVAEARRLVDICLGAGAHTHYFDKDNGKVAQKVASVVDALVAR